MRLHRCLDDALGELREAFVKAPRVDTRALDQVDDLFEDTCGIAPAPDRIESLHDLAPPFCGVGLDVCRAKRLRVVVRRRDLDLSVREAMPV